MNHLYSIAHYDRSAKARWLLTEMKVEFQDHWLNRESKEFDSPEFLKLNPMGRVPVLRSGDVTMFESGAICSFLADQYREKSMAPALGTPDRAHYEQWMYFAASTLDPLQTRIMIIEDIPPGELFDKKMNDLLADVQRIAETLNSALSRNSFLVGGRFSTADICVSYHLNWSRLWPELAVVLDQFPNVVAYLERMKGMSSAVEAKVFSYNG